MAIWACWRVDYRYWNKFLVIPLGNFLLLVFQDCIWCNLSIIIFFELQFPRGGTNVPRGAPPPRPPLKKPWKSHCSIARWCYEGSYQLPHWYPFSTEIRYHHKCWLKYIWQYQKMSVESYLLCMMWLTMSTGYVHRPCSSGCVCW